MENEMKDKAANFLAELRELCIRHGVCLAVSGYDALDVWDLNPGEDPIHACGIRDRTNSNEPNR